MVVEQVEILFLLEKQCVVTAIDEDGEAIDITRQNTNHNASQLTLIKFSLKDIQLSEQYY